MSGSLVLVGLDTGDAGDRLGDAATYRRGQISACSALSELAANRHGAQYVPRVLVLAPQPSPAPTVTVTETVVVPTSVPTPVIQMPSPDLDFWKDIVFGEFGSALIAAVIAIGVAYILVKREREERLDDRRRDLAMQLCTELQGFLVATRPEGDMGREDRAEARVRMGKISELASILTASEHKDPHTVFRDWLGKYERRLMEAWVLRDDIVQARAVATRFLAGVQLWHANPHPWQKVKSAEAYDPQLREDDQDSPM